MHKTALRKVGGSVMVAVPPAFLDQMQLKAGSTVGLEIQDGSLVLKAAPKPQYNLAELLAATDFDEFRTRPERDDADERVWVGGQAEGGELL